MNNEHNCIVCGAVLQGRQTLFCSTTCKNKRHQSYKAQKSRGLTRKLELLQTTGDCCVLCGYNKNLAALTFHHVDADEKSFKLDMRSLSNRRIKVIRTELEKCILVCQNCHAELHNPHLDLADLVP